MERHITTLRGEAALAAAVFVNSFGVVLMLYSGAGISAISSVPYAFSESFPALIVTGIDLSFTLRFNEPGYYRVRLQLEGDGGFTKYWYITVADTDATNVITPG